MDLLTCNQSERDAWFLRMYAQAIREKRERCIDIPSVIASVIEGIAKRLERPQGLEP